MVGEALAVAAAEQAVGCGITTCLNQSKYVFCFNTYVEDLREKLDALEADREGVLQRVEKGERNNEERVGSVKLWLENVDKAVKHGKKILGKIDKPRNSCFCGSVPEESDDEKAANKGESVMLEKTELDKSKSSPSSTGNGGAEVEIIQKKKDRLKLKLSNSSSNGNGGEGFVLNPWIRYWTSREAEEVTNNISELRRKTFEICTHPIDLWANKGLDFKYFLPASRQTIVKDIYEALNDDKISVVGLWGPSGVGKSTLLDLVVSHVKQKKFGYGFDELAKATVSRTPDIERIQAELADWLGLSMLKEISCVDQKAKQLKERLSKENKKYLVILDDLARKIDLERIGIPFTKGGGQTKLLLTSRNEEVLQSEMASDRNFKLGPFEEVEAFQLFRRTLDKDVSEDKTLELIKGLLTNECAGLPLSITQLAIHLRSAPPMGWKDTLMKLQGSSDLGVKNFINEMLEPSDDVINSNEVKSLLLLCAQIGTQIISVDKLVIYGMSLGIFEKIDTIKEARNRVDKLLEKLKLYCLLKDEKPGFIKIHDCVSDVVLGIDSKAQHSLVVRSRDQLMNAYMREEVLKFKSISLLNISDIEELPQGLRCPELNMFSFNYTEDHTAKFKLHDAIFQDMEKLKVLELSHVVLVPLSQSIQLPHQLQTLCLDSCGIVDFTFLGELKRLQVLIVRKSEMVQLPKEIAELTDLRVLDLSTCDKLYLIGQGILGSLTKLEELLLPKSFMRWDERRVKQPINASLTELSNMPCLSALHIRIPDFTALPIDIPLANLMRYSLCKSDESNPYKSDEFNPYKIQENVVAMDEARTLTLKLDPSSSRVILEDFVQIALQKVRALHLSGWVGFEESVASLFKTRCSELKHIDVCECNTIEYIFDLDQQIQVPSLESLHLRRLERLEKIGGLLEVPFGKLKAMTIASCGSLRHLFSFSLMNNVLPVLEELEVVNCRTMTHIFVTTAKAGTVVQGEIIDSKSERLELKCLKKLKLENLPELLSFCFDQDHNSRSETVLLDGRQVSFPRLESLTLSGLGRFTKIADDQDPPNLQSLKSLLIHSCTSLTSAIGSKLLAKVTNLEVLTIDFCDSMEAVFELDGESSIDEAIKLNELKLIELPRLKEIWKGTPRNMSCIANLRLLMVSICCELAYLFPPSMAKSLENLSCLYIENCMAMKGVFMEEMSSHEDHSFGLPSLKELQIKSCCKMNSFISMDNISEDEKSFFTLKVLLPSLEKLVLIELGKFKSIWGSNIFEKSFDKLTSVDFRGCDSGAIIFPSIMVKRLQDLKEINIVDCSAVEVIFESSNENFRLSKLSRMRLEGLPKFAHIVMSSSNIPNKTVLSFPSLNDIKISGCHNLINLFDTATAMTLSQLQNLEIYNCRNMKEIVSEIGGDKNVGWKMMAFNKLSSLQLCRLDKLSHFCSGCSKLYFPVLKTLRIIRCADFRAFVPKLVNAAGPEHTGSGIGANVDNEDGVFYPLFDDKVMLPNLQHLKIKGMEVKAIWNDKFPSSSFCKLLCLKVVKCHRISIIIPFFMLHNLHNLEQLTVKSCSSVEVIFQLDGHTLSGRRLARSTVCKLKKIRLFKLPKLHSLHKSESFPEYFPFHKLESLQVQNCSRLMYLFTSSMAKFLKKLEELTISNCEKLEVVVAQGIVDHNGEPYRTVFPQLAVLKLDCLQKLRSFCTMKHTTEWPSLKRIEINDCNAIEAFVADSEKHVIPLFLVERESRGTNVEGSSSENNKSGAFCKLKILQVRNCSNILTIFPSTIAGGFQNLEELTVENCGCLREVFQAEDWNEESASADNMCFEKLRKIVITSCCSLVHVFPTSVAKSSQKESWGNSREGSISDNVKSGAFCKLEILLVQNCCTLLTIFPDNIKSGAFCKLEVLQVRNCYDLLTIFPSGFAGGFRNLEASTVVTCDHLKEVFQVEGWKAESASADNICFEKLRKVEIESCESLERVFPTSVARSSQQLSTLTITNCGKIEEIVTWKGECNKNDKENAHHPMAFFPNLTSLTLKCMPLLKSFYGGLHSTKWPLLKELEVFGCPGAKILSSEQERWNDNDQVHQHLWEKLWQADSDNKIPSLKETWIEMDMLHIPDEIIGNPTSLLIRDIKDDATVKAFPWRFLLQKCHDLNVLAIGVCFFEEIFPWSDNRVDGHESDEIVSFPYRSGAGSLLIENIRRLVLYYLPKLKYILKDGSALAHILDIVEELAVEECPLLRGILCPSPSSPSAPTSFNHMKVLQISKCNGLRHVLTTSAARCLVHLTKLEVKHCQNLEEIVINDDFNGDQNEGAKDKDNADITFHQLSHLKLSDLPSLQGFSSTNCHFNFPYLVKLDLNLKPRIKKKLFSEGIVNAPLLSEQEQRNVGIGDSMERKEQSDPDSSDIVEIEAGQSFYPPYLTYYPSFNFEESDPNGCIIT